MSPRPSLAAVRPGGAFGPLVPLPAGGPAGSNAVLGTLIFLATEAMLFAGLVSAFLVLRAGAGPWPPAGQPRFPAGMTALNTLVLLASGWTVARARAASRRGLASEVERWLALTAVLGALFLAVQGIEWVRLVRHGLRLEGAVYGGLFSTLIGVHGLHVLGGMAAVLAAWLAVWRGRLVDRLRPVVTAVSLYWSFVVGVWPILYVLVYLW